MRRLTVMFLLVMALAIPAFAEYPPEGWNPSIIDAIETAQAEDKMLLLNFTGSDWCSWCEKLGNEVFNTPEFESWSDDNVVQVFLDYPRSIELSNETMQQNALIQQMLGVSGFPTIWLMDNDLTPLLRTGYVAGGAESYIEHLEGDQMVLEVAEAENFRKQFKAGIEQYLGPINPQG